MSNAIHKLCKDHWITNYTINNGLVDVEDDVNLNGRGLSELPIRFGQVSGYFDCNGNGLTNLEGSPHTVNGNFSCFNNKLTSLIGSPHKVGGKFDCEFNKLTSLIGSPYIIGLDFLCSHNQITSLDGLPNNIMGMFGCSMNPIGSIFDDVEIDFLYAFNTYKVIDDGNVNIKRLHHVMDLFDKSFSLERIYEYYNIV
jgi:hypothetical protein